MNGPAGEEGHVGTAALELRRTALFAGDFWHGASERGLAQGLRNVGWNVQEVALQDHFLRSRDVGLRLAQRLLVPLCRRSYNAEILRSAARLEHGLLIAFKGGQVAPATLRTLQAKGLGTLLFYPDVHFDHAGLSLDLIREVDLLFTTKSFQLDFLHELRGPGRSFFVHHGYSPMAHRPHWDAIGEEDYLYDIAFVGSPDAHKTRWLSRLASAFPDRRMVIVGERWDRIVPGTPLEGCTLLGRVTGDLMAELVQRSRINVAVHAWPEGPMGWRDRVSTRTFEIPACKGFMLHEANAEVAALFEAGSEIDLFETPEELCEKVGFYLARPALRQDMLERAYRRAVPAYSYYERAREMAAIAARELGL